MPTTARVRGVREVKRLLHRSIGSQPHTLRAETNVAPKYQLASALHRERSRPPQLLSRITACYGHGVVGERSGHCGVNSRGGNRTYTHTHTHTHTHTRCVEGDQPTDRRSVPPARGRPVNAGRGSAELRRTRCAADGLRDLVRRRQVEGQPTTST